MARNPAARVVTVLLISHPTLSERTALLSSHSAPLCSQLRLPCNQSAGVRPGLRHAGLLTIEQVIGSTASRAALASHSSASIQTSAGSVLANRWQQRQHFTVTVRLGGWYTYPLSLLGTLAAPTYPLLKLFLLHRTREDTVVFL